MLYVFPLDLSEYKSQWPHVACSTMQIKGIWKPHFFIVCDIDWTFHITHINMCELYSCEHFDVFAYDEKLGCFQICLKEKNDMKSMEQTWLNSLLFNLLEEGGHLNHNKGNIVLQNFFSIGLDVPLVLEGPITPPTTHLCNLVVYHAYLASTWFNKEIKATFTFSVVKVVMRPCSH
jgi:hypothetical protein